MLVLLGYKAVALVFRFLTSENSGVDSTANVIHMNRCIFHGSWDFRTCEHYSFVETSGVWISGDVASHPRSTDPPSHRCEDLEIRIFVVNSRGACLGCQPEYQMHLLSFVVSFSLPWHTGLVIRTELWSLPSTSLAFTAYCHAVKSVSESVNEQINLYCVGAGNLWWKCDSGTGLCPRILTFPPELSFLQMLHIDLSSRG